MGRTAQSAPAVPPNGSRRQSDSRRKTEREIRAPLFDGGGLYLELAPNGGKWWRLKFRFTGKEKRLSLGVYPHVALKQARERRDEARKMLANGVDPSEQRKATKSAATERAANSFEAIGREWFASFSPKWVKGHSDKILRRLEHNVYPHIGGRPIAEITSQEMLAVLRKVESRGAIETAHRTKQNCSQVFRYAVATGRADRDPTIDLRGALLHRRGNGTTPRSRTPRPSVRCCGPSTATTGHPVTKAHSACASYVRSPRRTAARGVDRVQPRQGRMAHRR